MNEYIDRQAVLDAIPNAEDKKGSFMALADFIALVQSVPAADVAPVVHGDWAYRNYYAPSDAECDICGFEYDTTRFGEFKYCPHCSAKMDGGG